MCPNCGLDYGWNGSRCSHCRYPDHESADSTAQTSTARTSPYAMPTQPSISAQPATEQPAIFPPANPTEPQSTRPAANTAQSSSQPKGKSATISGLDIDKFAPISTDQALEESKSASWKTAYLDPLNIIPSADLPRIRVIDQTMVGLGLISSEELARIHEVGEEYGKYRSVDSLIHQAGEVALQQSKADKAALIKQKKEEAAARKVAHAEAVAHRKATDIFFLGRGVSKGLADRRANVERLQQFELPMLATPAELAEALEISIPQLKFLAFHNIASKNCHYFNFDVPKKSGGLRRLSSPHQKLAAAQRWIFENVLGKLQPHEAAHGFVTGHSILTNALPHVGADIVINADLKNFFPSITFWRVEGLFKSFGFSPAVATILALLCTECPRNKVKLNGQLYHVATGQRGLPQGACTSPAISNLVARHLDLRLSGMARKLGWTYSRYADDLTLSQKINDAEDDKTGYVLARIRHIVDDEGFAVNEKKTRVLRNHTQQSVTGVVVNDRAGVNRKTVRQLRAILNNAKKTGLQSQNRENKEDFGAWLNGMISFVEMINRKQGGKLRHEFNAILKSEFG